MSSFIEVLRVIPDFFRRKFGDNDFINNSLIGFTGKMGREKFASNMIKLSVLLLCCVTALAMLEYFVLQKTGLSGELGRPGHVAILITIVLAIVFDAFQVGLFVRRIRFLERPVWEFLAPYLPLYLIHFGFKFKAFAENNFTSTSNSPSLVGMGLSTIIFITYFYGIVHQGQTTVNGDSVEDDAFKIWYPAWGMLFLGFTISAMGAQFQ